MLRRKDSEEDSRHESQKEQDDLGHRGHGNILASDRRDSVPGSTTILFQTAGQRHERKQAESNRYEEQCPRSNCEDPRNPMDATDEVFCKGNRQTNDSRRESDQLLARLLSKVESLSALLVHSS